METAIEIRPFLLSNEEEELENKEDGSGEENDLEELEDFGSENELESGEDY